MIMTLCVFRRLHPCHDDWAAKSYGNRFKCVLTCAGHTWFVHVCGFTVNFESLTNRKMTVV